jgi:hypothetical protein
MVASLVMALVFSVGTAQAKKTQFVAIATGGTGGVYYPLGGALAQIISNKLPDVAATAQSGNASVANCNLTARGNVETAFVQNNVADSAYNGRGPWEGRALKNLRAIASLYPETIQIVAREEADIETVDDAKGKRVAVGDKGSGTEFDARNILEYHNLTYDDISPDYVDYSVAAQRLKDDQDDMLFKTAGLPTAAIIDLSMSKDVNFVSLSDKAVSQLVEDYPFYVPMTIPAGTYDDQDEPVQTIAMMAIWITHDQVDEELVYNMTKVLWEKTPLLYREKKDEESGAEILAKVHQQGKNVSLDTALKGITIPLHPGAEKYYKEIGMIE